MTQLALGTVQFGLDYGISNGMGQTPLDEVRAILECAAAQGIDMLDTAPAYGESESVLGCCLPLSGQFAVVSKVPRMGAQERAADFGPLVRQSCQQSLQRTGQSRLYGLLVHHADDCLQVGGEAIYREMEQLKREGLTERIGFSLYDAQQIEELLARYTMDFVQLPLNVLDQRLLRSGHLSMLARRGVEIHVRSVFLQGLLLMEPSRIPGTLAPLVPHLRGYHQWLTAKGLNPLEGALAFLRQVPEVSRAVVGVNSLEQLREIAEAWERAAGAPREILDFGVAASLEEFIDPRRWKE